MYAIVFDNNYLKHHGKKGQEWGVKNGPPYPLDYKALAEKARREGLNNNEVISKAKIDAIRRGDLKEVNMNREYFTDQEVRDAMDRFQLNQSLDSLANPKEPTKTEMRISKAEDFIEKAVRVGDVAEKGARSWDKFAKIANGIGMKPELPILLDNKWKGDVLDNKYKELKTKQEEQRLRQDTIKANQKEYQFEREQATDKSKDKQAKKEAKKAAKDAKKAEKAARRAESNSGSNSGGSGGSSGNSGSNSGGSGGSNRNSGGSSGGSNRNSNNSRGSGRNNNSNNSNGAGNPGNAGNAGNAGNSGNPGNAGNAGSRNTQNAQTRNTQNRNTYNRANDNINRANEQLNNFMNQANLHNQRANDFVNNQNRIDDEFMRRFGYNRF